MKWMGRLRSFFQRERMERELDEELRAHVEMRVEENIAAGMSPEEARYDARRRFGNFTLQKEDTREVHLIGWLETTLQDLRFAARMLVKNKAFTMVAVLSLALGIGANTALFSVANDVLLKTLPVAEPERLVLFAWHAGLPFRVGNMSGTSNVPKPPGTRGLSLFSYQVFDKMRQAHAARADNPLSDFFAFAPLRELTAVVGDQAEIINGQAVTGGYFAGLQVQASPGRAIRDEDDKPGAPPVVVLSHQFWQERFGANPAVIGQPLKLNKQFFTIIGVTPPAFTGTLQVDYRPAVTVPLACEPLLRGERSLMGTAKAPGVWWMNLMGRLKPGASYEQARDSLNGAFQAAALEVMPPPSKANEPAKLEPKNYPRLVAESGSRGMLDRRRDYSGAIYGLFIVVALVLLIACANVANLLLARAALRGPEISMRLAIGAGRWRLVRQLLTESVLLAALGGAVGVLFAFWGKSSLLALTDKDTGILPSGVDLSLNWRVLAFTLGVSLLTGVLFGLAPAWRATGLDLATALKHGGRTTGAVSRLSQGLIVAQVALSLLLLVGAGLFLRTLYNLQGVNLGFNQENLLLFRLQPDKVGYKDERLAQFYQQLFARLDNLPGVRAATFGGVALIANDNWFNDILLPGETKQTAGEHETMRQVVRENYFATLEIPLLRGRGFTARDDQRAPQVAIVNHTFAGKFFPHDDALGQRITIIYGKREVEIIGVVADTQYMSQREELQPLLYTPWQQEIADIGVMNFTLRTAGEPTALAATVRQVVRESDNNLPVTEVATQTARSQATLGQERLYARLVSFFGGLALLLAAVGIYGVLSGSVAARTREIGVRAALGAPRGSILALVMRQGMMLTGLGVAIGLAGAAAASQAITTMLFGVSRLDPVTYLGVIALLLGVSGIACWVPARRASRVDPMEALRYE